MIQKIRHITSKNSHQLWTLSDQALVSGTNFLMGILLARLLGLENYGLFAFGWMLVLFVSSVQLAFIVSPLFTLYPKHANQENYVSAVHTIQIIFSVLVFVVCTLVVHLVFIYQPTLQVDGITYSLPLAAALFVWQDFYRRVNFTHKKPVRSFVSDAIAYGLQPIAIIALHQFGGLTIHTTFLSMSVLFWCAILYNGFKITRTYDINIIKNTMMENWSFSKYLVGTSLLQWVSGNFFIIVAGGILGPIAIGAVRIAQNIVGVLHVLFSAMENSMPIKGAEILARNGALATLTYFKKMLLKGGAFTLVVLGLIALASEPLIEFFYGAAYLSSINILLGFTGIYVLVFLGTILGFVIRTFEMNHIFFWSYIATTAFSLLSAHLFISQMGVYGVLLGLLITQLINISFYSYQLNSKIKAL